MSIKPIFDELVARGTIEQISHEEDIRKKLGEESITVYVGFDPTAPSLHVGSLVPVMFLARMQRAGHHPIVVMGGATGMVGDPSGKSTERKLMDRETIQANIAGQQNQMTRFLDFSGNQAARVVNNHDWTAPVSYLEWLRDVGKHFTVNHMMAKESVRRRLEDRDQGISYTEFSYMLLQANDFLHLYDTYNCTMQGGGNDQWGNITAGLDLIHKVRGTKAYAMTFPLLTTASGEKFGKSEGNAVWLDANMTSPYQFYQYWMQSEDKDLDRFLKLFTFLSLEAIAKIVTQHQTQPEKREGQRVLAEEMTRLVHGEEALQKARQATAILFGSEINGLSDRDLQDIFSDVPSATLSRSQLENEIPLVDLFSESGLCSSKGEAKRLLKSGGAYVNNRRVTDLESHVSTADLASETTMVLRSGKRKYLLVRFT